MPDGNDDYESDGVESKSENAQIESEEEPSKSGE